MHGCTRRGFMGRMAAGVAVCALGPLAGCDGAAQPKGRIAAGALADLPVGTLRAVSGGSVAVGHDEGGLYAMTLICTHGQCDMAVDGSVSMAKGIACDCHGSRFDVNGAVTRGPAERPLRHFAVLVEDGQVVVDADQVVPAETRTPAEVETV